MAWLTKRTQTLILAIALLPQCACEPHADPLVGRVYLPSIPRDELDGTWALPLRDPTLLQVVLGGRRTAGPAVLSLQASSACHVNQSLAELLLECDHAYVVDGVPQGGCQWSPDGSTGGEVLKVTYKSPDGKSRLATFSAFRHSANRDIALVGTCGMGDAYALLHQRPQAP
jgi:hypothetical protein